MIGAASKPEEKTIGSKIIRNALFGGLRFLLIAPVPFLLTPLILRKIGTSGYGTWAVLLALVNLTSLADLGLVGTIAKHVAEFNARKDFAQLNRVLDTGLALFGLLAIIVPGVLWLLAPIVVTYLFQGSPLSSQQLVHLFRWLMILIACNIVSFLFSSVLSGLQRLDLTNVLATCNVVLAALFSGFLLFAGWGLHGLVIGNVVSAVLILLAYSLLVHRLLPQLTLNPLKASRDDARMLFQFSVRIYVTQAAVAVHNQVEKLYLARLTGVAAAGWYDIASDAALKVRSAPGLLLTPVLPAAAELDAHGAKQQVQELYFRAHKYLALFGVPFVVYVAAVSGPFIDLWIGPNFHFLSLPLTILVLVNFFNLTSGPGYLIYAGQGNLSPGIRSAVIGIMLNVILSFVFIHYLGFSGAVLGTTLSLVAATVYFHHQYHHHSLCEYSVMQVIRKGYLKPIVCSAIALCLVFVIRPLGVSWIQLAICAIGFAMAYLSLILITGFFDDYDWSKIESYVPIARVFRRLDLIA